MSSSKLINVMISSRCNDTIEFQGQNKLLSDLREKIKEKIENYSPFGKKLFKCWINEDAPPAEGTEDSWDHCLNQVKECDLLLVLYNGNSGWSKTGGDIGICHAELATGLDHGRGKVYLIEIPANFPAPKRDERERNKRFELYKNNQNLFRGKLAKNGEDVLKRIDETLHQSVVNMFRLGVREARKGKHDTGEALAWNRLPMDKRKYKIESVINEYLKSLSNSKEESEGNIFVQIKSKALLFRTHGIPDSMSISAAREMVGRPFVKDFEFSSKLSNTKSGPVHLIGCHKGVTEAQIHSLIGHPDITVVTPGFGIYAVDNYSKIQLLLISNCRDETSTRHGIQRAFEWLTQSGEDEFLLKRAKSRTKIINAISKEV